MTPDARSRPSADVTPPPAHVRPRAVVLGFVLAMAICAVTPFNNAYRFATPLGGGHFPLAPFFLLLVLTVLLAGLRRVVGGAAWLSGKELLTAWALMLLASGIAWTGLARTFFINLTAPIHFATVENRWAERLQPLLPAPLYPQDAGAVQQLYNGLPGGRDLPWHQVLAQIPWHSWLTPLVTWGLFVLAAYWVMVCLINLLGRQALENERMNFPLLRVPLMLGEALDNNGLGRFFNNRFFLVGLSIPVALHVLNGLNYYMPEVPHLPTLILAGPYFPKHGLFSGFSKLKIYLYPAFIGFAFLTSKQISLSFWLFHLLGALLIGLLATLGYSIPAASLGITFGPTLSRPEETQMIGAYGVFFLFLLWLARHHLADVARQAVSPGGAAADPSDWLPVRTAFWGFVGGSLLLWGWLYRFGLSWPAGFLVLGAFFMIMLVATRIICQGGIAYFTLTAAPLDGLLTFLGPRFFTPVGLVLTAVAQKVLFVDLRESLMPSLLHGRRLTHGSRARRWILAGVGLTLAGGVVVSLTAMLALCYKFGIRELQLDWATRTTLALYENLNTLIDTPIRPGPWVWTFAISGAVVMLVLVLCYHRYYWWPIHPIGYLTAYSSAMRILWFSFFAGWLANALCMRYGGVQLFRRVQYFFVGLIVGDLLMGGAWAIYGMFSYASYQVLPS